MTTLGWRVLLTGATFTLAILRPISLVPGRYSTLPVVEGFLSATEKFPAKRRHWREFARSVILRSAQFTDAKAAFPHLSRPAEMRFSGYSKIDRFVTFEGTSLL